MKKDVSICWEREKEMYDRFTKEGQTWDCRVAKESRSREEEEERVERGVTVDNYLS